MDSDLYLLIYPVILRHFLSIHLTIRCFSNFLQLEKLAGIFYLYKDEVNFLLF